jgi:hypothetical protein
MLFKQQLADTSDGTDTSMPMDAIDPNAGAGVPPSGVNSIIDSAAQQCANAINPTGISPGSAASAAANTFVSQLCGAYVQTIVQGQSQGQTPPALNTIPGSYIDTLGQLLVSNPTINDSTPNANIQSAGFPIDIISALSYFGSSDPTRALTYFNQTLQQWPTTQPKLMGNPVVMSSLIDGMAGLIQNSNTANPTIQIAVNNLCGLQGYASQYGATYDSITQAIRTASGTLPISVEQKLADTFNQLSGYLQNVNASCVLTASGTFAPGTAALPDWVQTALPPQPLGVSQAGNSSDPTTVKAVASKRTQYLLLAIGGGVLLGGLFWAYRRRKASGTVSRSLGVRMKKEKRLSNNAVFLLNELLVGNTRIFASDSRPPGWLELERQGLAVRDANNNQKAILTEAGRKKA